MLVFSAPERKTSPLNLATLASTRRIALRNEDGEFRPAAAIVLNSGYWGTPAWSWTDDSVTTMAAQHELFHARTAWLLARQVTGRADAIEARLRELGRPATDRNMLEQLIHESILSSEETQAVDESLRTVSLPAYDRRGILEYRESNRMRGAKANQTIRRLFGPMDTSASKTLTRWLTDLLQQGTF